ncbi:MAG: alkaline phosphatase [Bacteroidota bacterium]
MKKLLFLLAILLAFTAGGFSVYQFLFASQRIEVRKQLKAFKPNKLSSASSQPKAKNVILLIGDGMGLAQVSAGMAINNNSLQLERCSHTGLMKTQADGQYITDSAAGATAMACGEKTKNKRIAMSTDGRAIETILEIAEKQGMSTGLIASSSITHATPAAFIAHQKNRNSHEAIAEDFLKTDIDVVIGGGMNFFRQREDQKDLTASLKTSGYAIFESLEEAKKAPASKFYALCAGEHLPSIPDGRGEFLKQSLELAITNLSQNEKGFFLMAESSQIDWAGHNNDAEYLISELLDFDQSIAKVLDFAAQDSQTLVIITADHETGGMSLADYDDVENSLDIRFSSLSHTPIMVPVFAFGPGAESFTGIFDNTEIFYKMMAALGLSN